MIFYHGFDIPEDVIFKGSVAIDTEAMGLCHSRDRLCLVQISDEDSNVHLVHFKTLDFTRSPNLKKMLQDPSLLKIFHFARFDVGILQYSFGVKVNSLYCTKIASHLVRTFTGRHSLKDLCRELLQIELNKEEQTSDWGAPFLTESQKAYASQDVLHLHALKEQLDQILEREGRVELFRACCDFLSYRCELDRLGGVGFDVLAYKCINS